MKKITKKNYTYALMLVLMASCSKSENLLVPKREVEKYHTNGAKCI